MRLNRFHGISSAILLALLIFGCAQKPEVKPVPVPVPVKEEPEEKLFQLAETEFQAKEYNRAIELYQDYLQLYPDSPLAPSALLKISAIYMIRKDYPGARDRCRRILETYPESRSVPEANINILTAYYLEGKYNALLEYAGGIDDNSISPAIFARKYELMGDAWIASGSFPEAAKAYLKICEKTDADTQKKILPKLDIAASKMTLKDLATIPSLIRNQTLRGHFAFLLGRKYADHEKYEQALQHLTDFTKKFPNHENTEEARRLIARISEMSEYDRTAIGCILPLSGQYETFGHKALKGIELAFTKFRDENPESAIKLVIKDSGGDPDKAAQAVRELADQKVAAIIGPIVAAETAAKEAQALKIPIITLTQKEGIPDEGDYVFRNFLTPEMQIQAIISFAMENLKLNKFAILYPNEKYGIKFMNLFWDNVVSKGGEVVGVESYDTEEVDFSPSIRKLAGSYYTVPQELKPQAEPMQQPDGLYGESPVLSRETSGTWKESAVVDFDAIFIPDGPEKVVFILPQLTSHHVTDVYLLGTNLWHSDKLLHEAPQYAQGAIFPDIFFAESNNPVVVDFVNRFEGTYGEKPELMEALAFDTALILFQTVSDRELHFRTSIKNKLLHMKSFAGVTGRTSFHPNGEADKKLFMLQISGDQFTELKYW